MNFQKQYKTMEIFKNTCKALNRILLSTGPQTTFQTASFRRILSMAIVSSKAFCEVTTKLRQTGELSGGQIILDDGSVFMSQDLTGHWKSILRNTLHMAQGSKRLSPERAGVKRSNGSDFGCTCSHKLTLREENLSDVLKTAHYLDCLEVVDQCKEFLMKELCFDNVLGFCELCSHLPNPRPRGKVSQLCGLPLQPSSNERGVPKLTPENLQIVLEKNDIKKTIFQSLINWI